MVFGGGWWGSHASWIEYLTISTTANSADFGDLPSGHSNIGGCSGG